MAKTPRFCKILLHDALRQEKLGIPNRFAKRYGNYLKDKVFLKVPCGTKWQVELLKNDDGIWFEDGWNSFVDYYSLKHGSFLVFAVEDFTTCTFNAVIFDSTSEMHYPFPVNGDHEETNVEEQVHQPINRGKISEGVQQTRISEDKPPLPFSRCCGKMQLGNHRTLSEGGDYFCLKSKEYGVSFHFFS
ncbi:AP2/B3-like transcriptional factor family protein [Euphorbia peplus]|nr:AP2/B3-like transcriptional factor family protein [Euphorbia peplus]